MKILILLYLYLFSPTWATNIDAINTKDLYLTPNSSTQISVPHGQQIKIRGDKIIHVQDLGSKIKIAASKEGEARISVGLNTYVIHVAHPNQLHFLATLNQKLKEFLDLHASIQNREIVITGQLHRLSDWKAIVDIAREYESHFKMLARVDADIKEAARAWVNSKLQSHNLNLPHLLFEPLVTAILPEDDKNLDTLWRQALLPLGIQLQYEKSQLSIQPLVRVRIVVAEVNKKMQSQLGVEWPEIVSASLAPKLTGVNSIEVFLKAMEQSGLGQILASPNLLARSGSEAEFLAGGEFGIKINTRKSNEVLWKRHGIFLKIKPQADRSGRLSIELSTEVSLIDEAQAVDGIPALKTNRMSTHFDLSQPRTIILSGLIRQDWGQSQNGVIGLAKIPIIGALFRSQDFIDNKTELVIFVTPEIVNDREYSNKPLLPKSWTEHD
ncbi:MAG: hypothetical protein KDD38_05940 [Bdellovibrionales bacterium]|nr:hypothetical protein [Bdellovibrionales bacterium]